jgi:GntR family transcriptional regulator
MSLVFSISAASDVPIYRQITKHIRLAIIQGRLRVGDQLPAVRTLAEDLVVNPNTVARAYQQLIRDGLLESRSGVGVFVSERRVVFSESEKARRLTPCIEQLVLEALVLGFSLRETCTALEGQWRSLQTKEGGKS